MYINKNTFIQVILEQFFFLFCTQKLQKAPKSTIESACGDSGWRGSLLSRQLVASTKQFSQISLLHIGAEYIGLHICCADINLVSEIMTGCFLTASCRGRDPPPRNTRPETGSDLCSRWIATSGLHYMYSYGWKHYDLQYCAKVLTHPQFLYLAYSNSCPF